MPQAHFNAAEVYAIAKRMEKEGLHFYRIVAEHATNPDVKWLFQRLAVDEVRHLRDVERFERELKAKPTTTTSPEEQMVVDEYVQNLIETRVFPDNGEAKKVADSVDNIIAAINYGIEAERRSIIFYGKAKEFAPLADGTEAFRRMQQQEEEHLRLLSELKNKFVS